MLLVPNYATFRIIMLHLATLVIAKDLQVNKYNEPEKICLILENRGKQPLKEANVKA